MIKLILLDYSSLGQCKYDSCHFVGYLKFIVSAFVFKRQKTNDDRLICFKTVNIDLSAFLIKYIMILFQL